MEKKKMLPKTGKDQIENEVARYNVRYKGLPQSYT